MNKAKKPYVKPEITIIPCGSPNTMRSSNILNASQEVSGVNLLPEKMLPLLKTHNYPPRNP